MGQQLSGGYGMLTILTLAPLLLSPRFPSLLGKLKELGNSVLGHFGLSVDNFKMKQDPATGSYSINFER